jgi:hypothetical protein
MKKYEFIKDIDPPEGTEVSSKKLYKVGEEYVVASQIKGQETMLFVSNSEGEVDNFFELWGEAEGNMELDDAMHYFVSGERYKDNFKQVKMMKDKMWSY